MNPETQQKSEKRDLNLSKIRLLLKKDPRNQLLFEMSMLPGVKIEHLLQLTIADMIDLKVGDPLPVHIKKEFKKQANLTTEMKRCLDRLLIDNYSENNDYLFKSAKGNRPLSLTSVSRLIRQWLKESNLTQYSGIRALRAAANKSGNSRPPHHRQTLVNNSDRVLSKINVRTRQEAVYLELERAIITGQLPPGKKLSTEEIARQMDVSRIPVREAMGRLEARGFIMTRPKWGSVVNELSRKNLKDILDLRLILECEAIAKAATKVREITILHLERAHREFARVRELNLSDSLLLSNREFHLLAYQDADSQILLEMINHLWDRVSPYYHIMFRQSLTSHPTIGIDFHEQIVDAMKQKDPERACYWVKSDLIKSAEFVLELFDLHQKGKQNFEGD